MSILGIDTNRKVIYNYSMVIKKGVDNMMETILTEDQRNEINEFVSLLLVLPKEDRAVLLSNANAFKVRMDIERARQEAKE